MTGGLLQFTCQNELCEKRENFIELSVLSESEAKRTYWLLWCGNCGRVVQTKMGVEKDVKGNSWLPCVEYIGPGAKLTTGPIPDDEFGNAWGDPNGGKSLNVEQFMRKYNINPLVDWCRRMRSEASKHPGYSKICGDSDRRKLRPIDYHEKVVDPTVTHRDHEPIKPPHHTKS